MHRSPQASAGARRRSWPALASILTALGTAACAEPAPSELRGPEQDALPVWGGSAVQRIGVVAVGANCTGVLLNDATVLTSGHCVSEVSGGATRTLSLSVTYERGGAGWACLTGGGTHAIPDRNTVCNKEASYVVSVYPGYVAGSGDTAKDLAVLRAVTPFQGVTSRDFITIDLEPVSLNDRLEFYGYGNNASTVTGAGTLRKGSGEVDSATGHQILLVANNYRGCLGDSGGPATIYFDKTSPELHVVGLYGHADGNFTSCPEKGAREYFALLSAKMAFIRQNSSVACREFYSPRTNRRVAQCYRL